MSIKERITIDLKDAMRARDQKKITTLRLITAAIKQIEVDERILVEDDARLLIILDKMVKQRKESADIYQQQGRKDLADVELLQISVIEQYLPKQMSEEEIKTIVQQIIIQVDAKSPADMGKVMGVASKQLAGKADGRAISETAKQLLTQ